MRGWLVAGLVAACGHGAPHGGDAGAFRDAAIVDGLVADAEASPKDGRPADASTPDGGHHMADAAPLDAAHFPDAYIPDAGSGAPGLLGMNDISFLLTLPDDPASQTTFGKMTGFGGGDLIPRSIYSQITGSGEVVNAFEAYHITAIRFDLCNRLALGPCPVGDGQVRLTFQPLLTTAPTSAADVALHVSYRIPAANLAAVIQELRALATLANRNSAEPLHINTLINASTASTEYVTRLRTLVATYATSAGIERIAVAEQPANIAPSQWQLSIIEPVNGTLQYVDIPGLNIDWLSQEIDVTTTSDGPTFTATPIAYRPDNIMIAMDPVGFGSADATTQRAGLLALNQCLDPTSTMFETVHCMDCHAATPMRVARAVQAGLALDATPGAYTSSHDLSIAGGHAATEAFSIRIFGWFGSNAEISQRVANDTAMVLDEINARFP